MGQWPGNRLSVLTRVTDLAGMREFSFPDIRGWQVLNTTGHKVGMVEEVFVDPNTLEPGMALLHYQKFLNVNTKMLLVPWHELRLGDGFVQTRWAEEELLPETARQVPDSSSPGMPMTSTSSFTCSGEMARLAMHTAVNGNWSWFSR